MILPRPRSFDAVSGPVVGGRPEPGGNPGEALRRRLVEGWPTGDDDVGDGGAVLAVDVRIDRVAPRPLGVDVDESYELEVTPGGVALRAATDVGARRGVETLLQLAHRPGGLRPATVADRPRFAWRGLLLDVCRHWIPPDEIIRTVDAMAAAKLNVLHLHLTDDQAFRIESRRRPELAEQGSGGHWLRAADVARIVGHAADAGIRVVPEIDLPGHTTSWLVSHPELAATPGPFERRTTLGIAEVALHPTDPAVRAVVADVLADVADLFDDPYLHVGGDEVAPVAWPGLDAVAEQRRFTAWVAGVVADLGRVPVVWDEAWHPDLPPNVVTQVWRGHRRVRAAAATGRPVVFSTPYYLDLGYDPVHHRVDPLVDEAGWAAARARLHDDPRLGVWAPLAAGMDATFDTLETADPSVPPTVADPTLVLGGEACLWTETVPAELVAVRAWPAAAAVADVLWAGLPDDDGDLHDRLDAFGSFLAATTAVDPDAVRRARFAELAGGPGPVADALAVLAEVCEPSKWYSRHALLAGGRIDGPFDRFVDVLAPRSSRGGHVADDATRQRWAAAAAVIAARLAAPAPPGGLVELGPLAERLAELADGATGVTAPGVGDVIVVGPPDGEWVP